MVLPIAILFDVAGEGAVEVLVRPLDEPCFAIRYQEKGWAMLTDDSICFQRMASSTSCGCGLLNPSTLSFHVWRYCSMFRFLWYLMSING